MKTENQNEQTTNDLIEVIWPLLDQGVSKDEIQAILHNVMDSWEPGLLPSTWTMIASYDRVTLYETRDAETPHMVTLNEENIPRILSAPLERVVNNIEGERLTTKEQGRVKEWKLKLAYS